MKTREELLQMFVATLLDLQSGCTDCEPELNTYLKHKLEILHDILGDEVPEEYIEQIEDVLK